MDDAPAPPPLRPADPGASSPANEGAARAAAEPAAGSRRREERWWWRRRSVLALLGVVAVSWVAVAALAAGFEEYSPIDEIQHAHGGYFNKLLIVDDCHPSLLGHQLSARELQEALWNQSQDADRPD